MRLVCITVAMLLVSPLSSAADKPADAPARKVDFDIAERTYRCGRVLAVSETSILIDVERKIGVTSIPFHDCLAIGKVHKKVVEGTSFKVSDIKVGDLVALGVITENKHVFCVDISISERPGGLLPPGQIVNKDRPWYQWRNAEIAFRDKGTPIPEHLKPVAPR